MFSDEDWDEQHLADLEHEACVQFTYGDNVILLSNFDNKNKNKITNLISGIKDVFIGVAFILNGIPYDNMFGVYSYSTAGAKEFWKDYNSGQYSFDYSKIKAKKQNTISEIYLLLCPFCGEHANFDTITEEGHCNTMIKCHVVKCTNCLARTDSCATKEEAAEEWNTRNGRELKDVYSCCACHHFSSGHANFDAGGMCLKHDQTCHADDGICNNFKR